MSADVVKFGKDLEIDRGAYELRRSGRPLKLERIPMEILLLLIERRGEMVAREEIIARVWGKDVFLDTDTSINSAVRKIRQVLKDDAENPVFLQTVTGKGYRFIAVVAEAVPQADLTIPEPAAPLVATVSGLPPPAPQAFHQLPAGPPGQTAGRPLSRLRWATALAALIVLTIGGIYSVRVRLRSPATALPQRAMLAVLPFANLSGDPGQDYFADGMTEELITQLGGISPQNLGVIARTSAMQYKNTPKSVAEIARELGVSYVLEGSVRRSGSQIRVTAQLIQARDQTHLWARDYDREMSDVLEIQSLISDAITHEVRAALPSSRPAAAKGVQISQAAHDAYLRGLQGLNQRSGPGSTAAIGEFLQAVSTDPQYAAGWAALARAYSLAPIFHVLPPSEAMPKARDAAQRALALDDASSEAHCTLGFIHAHYEFDWSGAEREFKRAIELNPSDPNNHLFYSNSFLSPHGRHDEAIAEMQTAVALDPLSFPLQSFFGRTLSWAHRYDDAMAQFTKANQMNPNIAVGHARISHLYVLLGRYDEAIAEEEKARILSGESAEATVVRMQALRDAVHRIGPQGYWQQELVFADQSQNPPEFFSGFYGHAVLYAQLHDNTRAIAALRKAIDAREMPLSEIAVERFFAPLAADPAFSEERSTVGLPAIPTK